MENISAFLQSFKQKIEEAVSLVLGMAPEEKLEAVQFWNCISEKLQDIINNSDAVIGHMIPEETEKIPKLDPDITKEDVPKPVDNPESTPDIIAVETSVDNVTVALIAEESPILKTETILKPAKPSEDDHDIGRELITTIAIKEKKRHGPRSKVVISASDMAPSRISPRQPKKKRILLPGEEDEENHPEENGADDSHCEDIDNDGLDSMDNDDREFKKPKNNKRPKKDSNEIFTCMICSKVLNSSSSLIVHHRRHSGERPFICGLCTASFSTKGNLQRHEKTHTGEKPFECTICKGRFTEKKSLKVHMRRHTGEKPYRCNICGKSFAQTGILQSHMALHLGDKSHLCDHCGKSFRQKSQLRIHILRHAGVRRYSCKECSAKFLTRGDLERHNRTHTGERPFICELCGKTFTRQQSLNEHVNRHYGLRPYICKYCSKAFAEMSACYKHVKVHEREGTNKYTVFVQTNHQLDVGSELIIQQEQLVEQSEHLTEQQIAEAQISDFTAINLLANASTFQQVS